MDGRRARLLVIDDEAPLGRSLARMLGRDHDVAVVTSVREALDRIILGERFDLILCDLLMPDLTGIHFYERIADIAPELVERVVFMTGGAVTPYAQAFLWQPFIWHLEKPFPSLLELRQVVVEHLRRLSGHR